MEIWAHLDRFFALLLIPIIGNINEDVSSDPHTSLIASRDLLNLRSSSFGGELANFGHEHLTQTSLVPPPYSMAVTQAKVAEAHAPIMLIRCSCHCRCC